jgi:cysteinyl-tRNA synthetase
LKVLGAVLGILQLNPTAFLQSGAKLQSSDIEAQIFERASAKASKNFALADEIRQSLLAQGIVLKDSASGTTWEQQS